MKTLKAKDTDYVRIPEAKIWIDPESGKKLSKGSGIAIKVLESDLQDYTCLEVVIFFAGGSYSIILEKLYVEIPKELRNSDQLLEVVAEINSGDFSRKMFLESFLIDLLFFQVIVEEDGLLFFVYGNKPDQDRNPADSAIQSSSKHNYDVINWLA